MNILITGVGGQGVITIKKILSYASIKEDRFFRASELHGLSQRGGSVNVHFRLDPSAHSPLIGQGEVDLIIGLDLLEAARAVNFASANSIYLVNDCFIPFFQLPAFVKEDFLKIAKRDGRANAKNIFIAEAAKICREKLKNSVFEGIFLLGFAFSKKLIPLEEQSLMFGIEKSVPVKFVKQNKEAFNLGKKSITLCSRS